MISVHRDISILRIFLNPSVAAFFLTIALVGLSDPCSPIAHASGNQPVEIKKTFDYGTLIEHTVSVQQGDHRASMRLSQRRQTAGSVVIDSAHLTFYPGTPAEMPQLTAPVVENLLADMMNALYGRLGNDLKLRGLGTDGFMGIKEVEKKGILAFDGYAPWQTYLENPKAFSQRQIHAIVRDRWKAKGVFRPISTAFAPLGYDAIFTGFEKLFVFPAGKCSFYPELEDLGIRKTDRFPYPGTISFSLTPKPQDPHLMKTPNASEKAANNE